MKITKLEVIKVKPRWMFLKMHTDTDIYGLGEPVLEGHCTSVEAVIKEFEDYLIGKDPMMIEHHLQAMYRGGFYRGGPLMLSAISGIEQAMWDIKGKYYNCPVYEMLGGKCRDKIRMYTHIKRTAVIGEFSVEEMLIDCNGHHFPGIGHHDFNGGRGLLEGDGRRTQQTRFKQGDFNFVVNGNHLVADFCKQSGCGQKDNGDDDVENRVRHGDMTGEVLRGFGKGVAGRHAVDKSQKNRRFGFSVRNVEKDSNNQYADNVEKRVCQSRLFCNSVGGESRQLCGNGGTDVGT